MKFSTTLLPLLPLVLASPLQVRQITSVDYLTSDTENQLVDSTTCADLTIIFARGTFESGNVGTLAGPPFFSAVASSIGSYTLAVQGVDYAANVTGFDEGGDPAGSALMAQLVGQAMSQCPDTKLCIAGYSQGGQLVHNAADMLSAEETAFVNSALIFGDPDDGEAVGEVPAASTLVICHVGDDICLHGDVILPPHLDYAVDAETAATFVLGQAGF